MDKHGVAIASVSLGWHESHTLLDKVNQAAQNGFQGIEMVHSDLEKAAKDANQPIEAYAASLRRHCDGLKLSIITMAPFENYEGSPIPLALRLRKAHEWIRLARILGAKLMQIPASYDPASLLVSEDTIIEELRMLADCGLPNPGTNEDTIVIAYEPMSWSVRTDTWQHALYIKRRVGRPNFKLCLDTYHILTKLWGDCSSPDGRIPGGDAALEASNFEFMRNVHPDDVGFIQLSDAEFMQPHVSVETLRSEGKHQGWYWSGVGRIFPFEEEFGAYLPMVEICKTWLVDLGWTGWVSMEIFHKSMNEKDCGPQYWAKRGIKSWEKVKEKVGAEARNKRGSARL